MESSSGQRDLRLALAGLQAGCLGSLLMIGWWLLSEVLQRRSPWIVPNLLATTFYGEGAYRAGFSIPTWAGLAYPFAVYCAAGILFALAGRERKGGWTLILVGAASGLLLNWLCFRVALPRLNPLVQIYSPDRMITVSHLLYGVSLASYPAFARAFIARSVSAVPRPAVVLPPPLPDFVALEAPRTEIATFYAPGPALPSRPDANHRNGPEEPMPYDLHSGATPVNGTDGTQAHEAIHGGNAAEHREPDASGISDQEIDGRVP